MGDWSDFLNNTMNNQHQQQWPPPTDDNGPAQCHPTHGQWVPTDSDDPSTHANIHCHTQTTMLICLQHTRSVSKVRNTTVLLSPPSLNSCRTGTELSRISAKIEYIMQNSRFSWMSCDLIWPYQELMQMTWFQDRFKLGKLRCIHPKYVKLFYHIECSSTVLYLAPHTPGGLQLVLVDLVDSIWSPPGFHENSHITTESSGVHLESTWSSLDSIWTPIRLHMNFTKFWISVIK